MRSALNTNLPVSQSAIPGYGNSFWMDVVAMIGLSSLLGSHQSTALDDQILAELDSSERAQRYRHESRVMFESADMAISEEVRQEFLKLAAEWLKLASETRKPLV